MARSTAAERRTGTPVCRSHRPPAAAYAGQWIAGSVRLGPGPTRAEWDGTVVSVGGGDADPAADGHAVPMIFPAAVRCVPVAATTTGPAHRSGSRTGGLRALNHC